jgi:hypothetical protein
MKKKELQVADATEMAREAGQRQERRKRRKQGFRQRETPRNYFPFTPINPDRPNFMGLNLEKIDCKILRAVQVGKARTIQDICKYGKLKASKVYERFRVNPDLREGFRMLVAMTFTLATPGIISDFVENASKNAKTLELFLKCVGLVEEPSIRLIQNFEPGLLSQWQITELLTGGKEK